MPILEWLNKGEATGVTKNLPYRILKANPELSYGEKSENMIIKGDNLEALQALLPYYKGQVKCIYIDPPYNTGNAFEHYDDNLEHSKWLSLMYPRLELLRELLNEKGIIFISIDKDEFHYLKIICDEIYGRNNYIGDFIWQKKRGGGNDSRYVAIEHEYILIYAKNIDIIDKWFLPYDTAYQKRYNEEDEYGKYYWDTFKRASGKQYYPITCPDGTILEYDENNEKISWLRSESRFREDLSIGAVRFVKLNNRWSVQFKQYMSKGKKPRSLLTDIAINSDAKEEILALFNDSKAFNYPKPEKLIKHLLSIATNKNDLVLDSFLGSGTTCAVAQKMGRKYIGIEMGEHAITHCVPRMKAVIKGEQGGISKAVNWNGGGGYTFYDLGETIFDENGNINKQVDFKTLASHVWFSETKTAYLEDGKTPLLGIYNDTAYYLLYNGILGDKKPDGGNVLTQKVFDTLPKFEGKKVIYGEATRMSAEKLKLCNITFKQTPYEIKGK